MEVYYRAYAVSANIITEMMMAMICRTLPVESAKKCPPVIAVGIMHSGITVLKSDGSSASITKDAKPASITML